MKNISEQLGNHYMPKSNLTQLLPPGWGINQGTLSNGFLKAFVCFGVSFSALHSTTPQIKYRDYA